MNSRKIFDFALRTFLFLSPLFFFREFKLSFARGLFFILGTFALFAISLGCEQKRKFSNIWMSLFLLLAFARMFFDNGFGSGEWFNFWLACANFIYVFCGVLLFYVVYCYVDDIKSYFRPIVYVCILNFMLTLAQIFKQDFMWQHAPSVCGFMENSSQLGQYSAFALPILVYLNPFFVAMPLFTLIASKSISPILASIIGMAAFGVLYRVNKAMMAGIGGVLLVLVVFLNFNYISTKWQCRPIMWQKTLKVALQKPYLGWGYGSFQEKVTNVKGQSLGGVEYSRPHNDYLHTAQEMGFPIVIVIGMFFINLFRKFLAVKNKDKLTLCLASVVIIVLVNMSGQTLIRYASISGTFIVLLALFCAEVENAGSV